VIALVDAHPDVGVSAAEFVGLAVAGFGPTASAVEVPMVGVHLDGLEDELVWRGGEGAVEVSAGDHVPKVAVDGIDVKKLAVFVPIVAPGIGGAMGEDFEGFAVGMKSPDAAFNGDALRVGRTRDTDITGAGSAAATVKPAVGSPAESIGKIVVVVPGDGEAIEDDFGLAIGDVVAIAIRNEEELRRTHCPDAAASEFDAGEHLQLVGEDLALVGFSVAVLVVENDDAIAEVEVEAFAAFGVSVVFGDPHAAFAIPSHCDGILDLGFSGVDGGLESFGEFEGSRSFLGRRRVGFLVLFAVVGRGEFSGGEEGGREREESNDSGGHKEGLIMTDFSKSVQGQFMERKARCLISILDCVTEQSAMLPRSIRPYVRRNLLQQPGGPIPNLLGWKRSSPQFEPMCSVEK